MSLRTRISINRETTIAMAILWLLSLACALTLGHELLQASALTFFGVLVLGCVYGIEDSGRRSLIAKPSDALFFFVVSMIFVMLSFAGDCVFGSIRSPDSPLLTACTEKAGIGFAITLLFAVVAVGMPLIGLIRFAVITMWKRDG